MLLQDKKPGTDHGFALVCLLIVEPASVRRIEAIFTGSYQAFLLVYSYCFKGIGGYDFYIHGLFAILKRNIELKWNQGGD